MQELAGLLCYSDPLTQTKGTEVGLFLTSDTKKCLIDAIVVATSSSDMQNNISSPGTAAASGPMKLSQMIKQFQVTQEMLIESRQN